jgi:hypothetical protein
VPEWYQKRFLANGKHTYWYLDKNPVVIPGSNGKRRRNLLPWGPPSCFAQDDLYTVKWGTEANVDIERFFFGKVDDKAKEAVEFFGNFAPGDVSPDAFKALLRYMSLQKLRTPKGLGFLSQFKRGRTVNDRLILMQEWQDLYCALWTECVWQIADCAKSPTKFIISDHPVTVYNRDCFPGSNVCRGFADPDIRLVATHTYFPLSISHVLMLTNLAWVRNPYQQERRVRPNPALFRDTFFNFTDIQSFRSLSEQEVREINYITKTRSLRYVAGAEKEWLFPEQFLPSTHWSRFGRGLLLMPEPREIFMGGQVMIGYEGGGSEAFGEYGHRPWQRGYKDAKRDAIESESLERFKAEFAAMQGPEYRGTSARFANIATEPRRDSEKYHADTLKRAEQYRARGYKPFQS